MTAVGDARLLRSSNFADPKKGEAPRHPRMPRGLLRWSGWMDAYRTFWVDSGEARDGAASAIAGLMGASPR